MKKLFWIGALAATLTFSACNNNNTNTISGGSNDLNFITNINTGTTIVNTGRYNYSLSYNNDSQWGTITVENLIVNNVSFNFETVSQSYQTSSNLQDAYFSNVKCTSQNISNANFLVTPGVYWYDGQNTAYTTNQDVVVGQFTLNDTYQVKTFFSNTLFVGETTTEYSYNGQDDTYQTNSIYYQLVLTQDNNNQLGGKIIMYNAKFSNVPQEPLKSKITIDNLDVDYTDGVLTVSGTNIIPTVPDGDIETENPRFIFNDIKFQTTSNDLIQADITFTVAGIYNGNFSGSYIRTAFSK